MSFEAKGDRALRRVLEDAREESRCSREALTVLQADPYRLDTPANHRDGAWVAEQLDRAIGSHRRIHWRGLHYAIVAAGNVIKPNGETYLNTDDDWHWLSDNAGKAARWLGYVDFERITDNRNSDPIIHRKSNVTPRRWLSIELDITIPNVDDINPVAGVSDFEGRQPYALAVFGEKASLEDVLLPIAQRFEADLYLPSGEISDTLLWRMAKDGVADGRRMVVFVLADCDPAGHQMAVSISRKLQALRNLCFTELEFEVVPVALTVQQVRDLGLPSTPLKETETLARGTSEQRSTLGEASPEGEEMLAGLALPIVKDDADLQPFVGDDAVLQPSRIIRVDEYDYVMSREPIIEAEKTITRAEFERTVWGIEQVVGWVAYKDEAKFRSLSKIDLGPPKYYDQSCEVDFTIDGTLEALFEAFTKRKPKVFGYIPTESGNTRVHPEDWLSSNIEDILSFKNVMFKAKEIRETFKPSMPQAERARKIPAGEVKRMILEARHRNGGTLSQKHAFDLLKPRGVTWRQVVEQSRSIDLEQVGETKRGPKGPRKKREVREISDK